MASDWRTARFSELCDIWRGGSPRPIHEWIAPEGIPWVKIADATAACSRYIEKTREFIRPEGRTKSREAVPGDLLLSNSATPGMPMFLAIDACIHDGWLLLRNFTGIDKLFCYYLLLYERPNIVRQGTGSVFTNLKTDILKNHVVRIPPLPEQRAIAHILGTLDDKIELNRRMNETLEGMARALFQSWFVDFDPVRAKAEGRDPGLPKPIADLFPDSFEDSELGEIPKGWRAGTIDTLANVSSGKRPDVRYSEPSTDACIPVWGGNGPMAFVPEPLVDSPILLTGRVGTLGSVFRITAPCWPSDNTLVLYPRERRAFEYLFLQLKRIEFSSLNRGSTQPLLTQTDLKAHQLVLPPSEVLNHYHALVDPLYTRSDESDAESRTLAVLRDALLPKLISGELRVKDAERLAEQDDPVGLVERR